MNQSIPPDLRIRKLRERYRKSRRRQLARLLVSGVALLLLAGIVLLASYGLRNVKIQLPQLPRRSAQGAKDPAAQLAASYVLRPAPRFVVVSGEQYFSAGSQAAPQPGGEEGGVYNIDNIAGYELSSGKLLWEQQVELATFDFMESGGRLICYRQYLTDPPHLDITAFSAADGTHAWRYSQAGASEGVVLVTPKAVVAQYKINGSYRIIGLNPKTGEKAWGIKPKLAGVDSLFLSSGAVWLELQSKQNIVAYKFGNVVGLIDTGTGKLLREHAASDLIHALEIAPGTECCYVLSSGAQENAYVLERLPFRGNTVNLLRFKAGGEPPAILTEGGLLILAYNSIDDAGLFASRLFVFRGKETRYAAKAEFSDGYVYDVLPVPGDPARLLVLTRQDEDVERLRGSSQIHELNLGSGEVTALKQIKSPVSTGKLVGKEWLLLTLRNELFAYSLETGRLRKLKRPRFDHTRIEYNAEPGRAVLLSSPEPLDSGQTAAQLQLLVYE